MLLPNLPPPDQGIHHEEATIQAFVNDRDMGCGTLYIGESHISWAKEGGNGGFSLQYPHMAVHAVTHDTTRFAHPCIYIALDINIDEHTENGQNGIHDDDDEDQDEDDEDSKMSEIRFVPRNLDSLDPMYKALNECQALHPDPTQSDSEDDLEEDDDEGHYNTLENGQANGGTIPYSDDYEGAMEDELEDDDMDSRDNYNGQFDDAEM